MTEQDPLTERILGCAYTVSNALGCGFLEKVYENALCHELRKAGIQAAQQQGLEVHYDGVMVGEFTADIVVEGRVILELKAIPSLENWHGAQCLNYLKASGLSTCLLINFGKPRLEIRRFVQ